MKYGDMMINIATPMEVVNREWALQLCVYAWLLGEPVGGGFVAGIEQLASKPPDIRVATFRSKIGRDFQTMLHNKIAEIWNHALSGHIFKELSLEESQAKCATLDKAYEVKDEKDAWFNQATRTV